MATNATLKNLTLAGFTVSPSDQWTLPLLKFLKETARDIDGSLSRSVKPTVSPATGPIRMPPKEVLEAIQEDGWELRAGLYNGQTYLMTDCSLENDIGLNTDGGILDLEITGNPDLI
jgi:hypothetical protein